eukprot:1628152-Rhodomonas_salina.1
MSTPPQAQKATGDAPATTSQEMSSLVSATWNVIKEVAVPPTASAKQARKKNAEQDETEAGSKSDLNALDSATSQLTTGESIKRILALVAPERLCSLMSTEEDPGSRCQHHPHHHAHVPLLPCCGASPLTLLIPRLPHPPSFL